MAYVELNKEAIANRMREWGKANGYPRIKDLAEALGTTEGNLKTSYLSGRSLPGAPLLAKLLELGCDLKWLLFGDAPQNVKNHVNEPCVEYNSGKESALLINILKIENEKLKSENEAYKKEIELYKQYLRNKGVELT